MMDGERFNTASTDSTQEFIIQIPSRLAERIHAYVTKNDTTITHVVIEALAIFLREQTNNHR